MIRSLGAAVILVLLSMCLQAPTRANETITFVVAFSPGGVVDVVARAVAAKMSTLMSTTIIIENKGGAGGNIAAQQVARAKPDGNTLLAFSGGMLTVNPTLLPGTPFSHKNFAAITSFGSNPNVFVVHPDTKLSTIEDLIRLARQKPGSLSYGTPGPGSSPHLCVEMLSVERDLKFVHVPYKGAADAIRDVIAKHITMACSNVLSVLPSVREGRLRAIAVTSRERHPLLSDVPTVAESGVPGFEMLGWYGLAAPAGTPKPVIDKLNRAAVAALRDPKVERSVKDLGLTPVGNSPEDFSKYIEEENTRWSNVIRKANLAKK